MSDTFAREVEEALQEDFYKQLWDKYGSTVVTVLVLVILGTAVYSGYTHYYNSKNRKATTQLITFLDKKESAGRDDLHGLHKAIADLSRAEDALQNKNSAEAHAIYASLYDNDTVPAFHRDMAIVLDVFLSLSEQQNTPKEAGDYFAMLAPLLEDPTATFHGTALFLRGLVEAQVENDPAKASATFLEITALETAAFSLQTEARALSTYYTLQTPNSEAQ